MFYYFSSMYIYIVILAFARASLAASASAAIALWSCTGKRTSFLKVLVKKVALLFTWRNFIFYTDFCIFAITAIGYGYNYIFLPHFWTNIYFNVSKALFLLRKLIAKWSKTTFLEAFATSCNLRVVKPHFNCNCEMEIINCPGW